MNERRMTTEHFYQNPHLSDWITSNSIDDTQDPEYDTGSTWLTQNTSHVGEATVTTLSHSTTGWSPAALGSESSVPSTPHLSSPSDSDSTDGSQSHEDTTCNAFGTKLDTFQDLLFRSLKDHCGRIHSTRFFPKTTFTRVIDEQIVNKELRKCLEYLDPAARENLAHRICGVRSFKKIFTLLTVVGKQSDIKLFVEQDVADDDLPFIKVPSTDSSLFQLGRRHSPRESLQLIKCFDAWSPASIRIFEDWQWTTLAPTFECGERKNIKHLELLENTPLPFTSHDDTDSSIVNGGQSTVFKVNIHPDHHGFQSSQRSGSFAVKRLLSKNRAEFEREVEMLESFSGDANPHLISLLATYEQHNEFYLIFFWAEADLLSFWRDINPVPKMDQSIVLWMAEQCFGIATGLSDLHHYTTFSQRRLKSVFGESQSSQMDAPGIRKWPLFGVHGDIKPQNVLWFKSTSDSTGHGILKISDFGLAEFKTDPGEIYKPSKKVAYSASYRPPERDLKNSFVGRSHDIWALGCLYLEMIAWILGGWRLVQTFHEQRAGQATFPHYGRAADAAFFQVESAAESDLVTVAVKPAVTQFIEFLRSLPTCTKYLHAFLDLIQSGMLVVKSTDPLADRRIEIGELSWQLHKLRQDCEDADFATRPVPHRKSKRSWHSEETETPSVKRRQLPKEKIHDLNLVTR